MSEEKGINQFINKLLDNDTSRLFIRKKNNIIFRQVISIDLGLFEGNC